RPPRQKSGVPIRSLSSRFLAALEQLDRSTRHDGRDRMLVDKLRVTVAPEQETEIVEPGDNALQLHSIDQIDHQWRFGFTNVIKEGVLSVLCAVCRHFLSRSLVALIIQPAAALCWSRSPGAAFPLRSPS